MSNSETGLWLRRFSESPAGAPPLICFPHAGGAASSFVSLSRALAPHAEVLAVQYPGRQDRYRERTVASISGLADAVVRALGPDLPAGCAFFGHSMGAAVAFEVARRYESRPGAKGPVHLYLSACRAPFLRETDTFRPREDGEILAELRQLSGTAQAILADAEVLGMALPALRADYRAIDAYRAPREARVDCPFTVLVGDADPIVPVHDAAAWRAHSRAGTEVTVFEGGHFYLDGHTEALAALIRARTPADRPTA
ncbi:thioesterase II family protein [Streptomyces sp. P6-2-1]|uniref:thioesterase II family protein n=1 Tax=Streptomyces sp. P6-2-1 TaxID=3422591 RepID=UPI003D35A56F